MEKIKKSLPYVFLFIFFLIWTLIILPTDGDEIWNYGFAHNIYKGLIPYKDFNMVVTPIYPMLMSIPFHLFGSNILVFHITHICILLIITFLLFKLFDKKTWLILILFFPFCKLLPNYNWFLLFLYIFLIFLESKKDQDFLIGIILGLFILTKQSVGFCMFLTTLFFLKEPKKFKKRFLGTLIPLGIFLCYLLITNSLNNFIDLCVLGLFDFANTNKAGFNIYVVFFILLELFTIYFIKKNPKDIKNYYALAFYTILIPIFGFYHFQFCLIVLAIFLLLNFKLPNNFNYQLFSICVIICFTLLGINTFITNDFSYPNDINHFEYRRLTNDDVSFTKEVSKFIKKNKAKKIIFINANGYYFKLVNDIEINYLDLINTGNWGFNGSQKLLKEIKKNKDAIFIVTRGNDRDYQTDLKAKKYILENGKKINTLRIYDAYILKNIK